MSRALCELRVATLGPGWTINGSVEQRYHGNLNLRREGLDAARLISDLRDIAFSLGSACASGSGRPSHVLARDRAVATAQARSSIRLGFGRYTSEEELAAACRRIDEAAQSAAELAGMTRVRFLSADGTLDREVEAPAGQRSARRRPGRRPAARRRVRGRRWPARPAMSSSTPRISTSLPPASEEEEDLLDLAAHVTRTSRLACQIVLDRGARQR